MIIGQIVIDMNIISLIVAISSVILAIVAIMLSILFFKFSSQMAEKTISASNNISSTVERLEKLYETFYSDTFSIMKETVDDMRKHAWSATAEMDESEVKPIEKKVKEQSKMIIDDVDNRINHILDKQKITENDIKSIKSDLRTVFNKAIAKSISVESDARKETLQELIISTIQKSQERKIRVKARDVVDTIIESSDYKFHEVVDELKKLEKEGKIHAEGKKMGPIIGSSILSTHKKYRNVGK